MLKRVSIQNFKSLKDVTLDLQKVNLLIGPNNSGKTNFLKALEFINSNLFIDDVKTERDIKYVNYNRDSNFVSFELLLYDNEKHYSFLRSFEIKNDITVNSSQKILFTNQLVEENKTGYPDQKLLRHLLYNIRIYKIDPNKFVQPGPVGRGENIINADSFNLVGFLDLVLGKYRKTVFSKIEYDLNKCIPEFDEIALDDFPTNESLKRAFGDGSFKRIGLTDGKKGVTYWADELSEGTLYFLALLCIINQPNPPKLLLLEEPEKGIHPRRIWEVMKFIFQLAEEKDIQIILTTHNEHVVNAFSSMPEAVFVFDKDEEGATHVRNLQKDIIEPSHQKSKEKGLEPINFTENLGENWLYGLIGGVPASDL